VSFVGQCQGHCVVIGRCKGYGFVEYAHNREKSELARRQLDDVKVSGSVLRCQFVPPSLVRFADLQSRCLLVTNIPPDTSTTATLCRVLSIVSAPVFCQVATTLNTSDLLTLSLFDDNLVVKGWASDCVTDTRLLPIS